LAARQYQWQVLDADVTSEYRGKAGKSPDEGIPKFRAMKALKGKNNFFQKPSFLNF